jgi:hypothetical protein
MVPTSGPGGAGYMTLKLGAVEFNGEAKLITGFFSLFLVISAASLYFFGPFFTVTTPYNGLALGLAIIVEGLVGIRAGQRFGGSRNFTGRLMSYYAAALFATGVSSIVWTFFARGQIPTDIPLLVATSGVLLGLSISAFALFISARSLLEKLNSKTWLLIFLSLVLSLILSVSSYTYQKTPGEQFAFTTIWPFLIFVQLASALILVSLLRDWYVTRPISIIAFGFIGYSVFAPIFTIVQFLTGIPPSVYWASVSLIGGSCLYVVGLGMSQVRPANLREFFEKQRIPLRNSDHTRPRSESGVES